MTIKQITTRFAMRAFVKNATKSFAFSVAALSFLTQSTVVYSQDAKRDQLWKFVPSSIRSDIGTTNYYIQNGDPPNICLGVVGVDTRPPRPGTPVEVFHCLPQPNVNDPRRDNLWRVDSAGSGFVRIRNFVTPNYCLGVVGVDRPAAGSRAEIFNCFGVTGDARLDNQWQIDYNSTGVPGYAQIRNRASSGLCLGVVGADRYGLGARSEVYYCK